MGKTKKISNKGITLIALVITIIVLLILAAVSIATLTGDNGILTKAEEAKEDTIVAQEKELIQLAYVTALSKKTNSDNITANELKTELNNLNAGATATDGAETGDIDVTFSETNHKYTIHQNGDEKGSITGPEEREVPDTPKEPPKTVGEAKTGGDTFSSKTTITDDKEKPVQVPGGFKIAEDSATDVEEGVVIESTRTGTEGSQFVWIPVTSANDYVRNTNYENKGVSAKAKDDENYLPDGIADEKQTVLAAGGFYISRYEAGKGDNDTLISKQGATVWVSIPQTECKTTSKDFINNDEVKSGLITGIQWDMVMAFVDNKKDGNDKTFNVTTADSSRHTDSKATSGQNLADKVCNIYDLEGNFYEYVAEQNDYDTVFPCVFRGGYCYSSSSSPASYRYNNGGGAGLSYSFRLVLYVM